MLGSSVGSCGHPRQRFEAPRNVPSRQVSHVVRLPRSARIVAGSQVVPGATWFMPASATVMLSDVAPGTVRGARTRDQRHATGRFTDPQDIRRIHHPWRPRRPNTATSRAVPRARRAAPAAPARRARRLHRAAPVGARGARGGPQAPRHVHRLHRQPRAHALPVGDHRQLGRRGAGRRAATASRCRCCDDGSVEVRDNGRGIPVDVEPKTGLSGVEVVMTKLHAGGKFGGGSYARLRRSARRRAPASSTRCPPGWTWRSTAAARCTP